MDFFTDEEIATLSSKEIRAALLYKLDFASEPSYAWNGHMPLVHAGQTWLPMYGAATIDGIGFAGGTASESVTVTLSGLPDQALPFLAGALAATAEVSQRMLTIYMQFFDSEWQPEGSPVPLYYGFMQPPKVTRTVATSTDGPMQAISIVAENALFFRSRPSNGRYTDHDQKRRSPTDRGLEFTKSLTFKQFVYPDY